MTGIVVALYSEAKSVIDLMKDAEKKRIGNKDVLVGNINGKTCALIISGIGKVSSALSTQLLIDKFNVKRVLNFGSVGGIKGRVKPLEYYFVEKCCQYDFDLSDLDNVPVGYIQDYDCVYFECDKLTCKNSVNLATGDRFTCKQCDIETVKKLDCSIFDMEGASIAQVCKSNSIPIYLLKGVTDIYGSGIQSEQFVHNLNVVCSGFAKIIPDIIEKI